MHPHPPELQISPLRIAVRQKISFSVALKCLYTEWYRSQWIVRSHFRWLRTRYHSKSTDYYYGAPAYCACKKKLLPICNGNGIVQVLPLLYRTFCKFWDSNIHRTCWSHLCHVIRAGYRRYRHQGIELFDHTGITFSKISLSTKKFLDRFDKRSSSSVRQFNKESVSTGPRDVRRTC